MGNEQSGVNNGEDRQERLEHLYQQYIRRQGPQRQESKKKKKRAYTVVDDANSNYMLCTNNMYEARIKKQIFKKQSSHFSDFNRKLRIFNEGNLYKHYENNQTHLDLPPTYNYHSKVMENMIPNKRQKIDEIDSSIYNILFSQDGSQLLVTTQENLYTYNEHEGEYKRGKVLYPRNITWTITDSDLSSSGRFLIHCSLNPFISIFDIKNGKYSNFYNFNDGEEYEEYNWDHLRFFSCKFSEDDTKIIASSGKMSGRQAEIKMFDVNKERIQDSIQAHSDDINSISFLNKQNPYVFISGSDDRTVKIWDTRALGSSGKCVGQLLGHVAGITHVDSRQDNFYIASNGKDSCVKLWDIRKKVDSAEGKPRNNCAFDYRMGSISEKEIQKIRNFPQDKNFDNSVQTFRGHKVGKTLMRCHFSPLGPTDRRYIYTASYCGKVFLYDILQNTTSEIDFEDEKNTYTAGILNDMEGSVVRDAAWHPHKMEIITTNLKGQLFRWYNNNLHFEEIEDIERDKKDNEQEDEEEDSELSQSQISRQSRFEDYDYDYNQYDDEDEDDDDDDDDDDDEEDKNLDSQDEDSNTSNQDESVTPLQKHDEDNDEEDEEEEDDSHMSKEEDDSQMVKEEASNLSLEEEKEIQSNEESQ